MEWSEHSRPKVLPVGILRLIPPGQEEINDVCECDAWTVDAAKAGGRVSFSTRYVKGGGGRGGGGGKNGLVGRGADFRMEGRGLQSRRMHVSAKEEFTVG